MKNEYNIATSVDYCIEIIQKLIVKFKITLCFILLLSNVLKTHLDTYQI